MRHRKGITLPDDARAMAVSSLVKYVNGLVDEPISELQGTLLLDHILSEIGPSIYNQAIAEARQYLTERTEELDTVLHHAEFPTEPTRRKRS
jgi:uncharacterized protein (DUF2164 family)